MSDSEVRGDPGRFQVEAQIKGEQYTSSYDVVMELNALKTISYRLGEDKRDLLEANTKLVCAIGLILETLRGGEVQDLHQIINAALSANEEVVERMR